MLENLLGQQATLRAQAEMARQRMETERASGEGPRFNAARQEYQSASARAAAMDRQVEALSQRISPEAVQAQTEYNRAVQTAEGVRDEERGRARRFQDTPVGEVWNATGGLMPAFIGAGVGAISRAATGGGRPVLYNYGLPAGEGILAGGLGYNIPLAYDAFMTPVENPERRAIEGYARELPRTHPRRQEWTDYANTLPATNPLRDAARTEFYDPLLFAERFGAGALEGTAGALTGAGLVRIGGRIRRGVRNPAGPSPNLAPLSPGGAPPQPPQGSPGLANLGGLRPNPPALPPEAPPPVPAIVGAPPRPPLPSLVERRARPNPDDPRGHWVDPSEPVVPGVTRYVSPQGRNEVFRDLGGNWQRRLPSGRTEFIGAPPRHYRRISQAEPTNLLALVGCGNLLSPCTQQVNWY